ncbi:MAG TPA: hypothetical protein VJ302_04400 [Blastocatellia bacterium]|nr:hypothetical protein [Blastocatellia bacterium]
MIRKVMLMTFCALLLTVGAITATSQSKSLPDAQNPPATGPVPKHVITWLMLRHVVTLNKQADEAEKKGQDGSKLRLRYKELADLSDWQAQTLNQIATECYMQVVEQDQKAQRAIDAFRAQVPGGKLADGQTPPPPPAELKELQKERNRLVSAASERLRQAFGEAEFKRFDRFINEKFAPHVRNLTPGAMRPGFRPATAPRQASKQQ